MTNIFQKKTPKFIAEISANHNGKIQNAYKLIDHAKRYGADFVKLQTYTPGTMTLNSDKKEFRIKKGLWKNTTLWKLYSNAQTPFEWQKKLFAYARKKKINCFSTPFDLEALKLLESLRCPIYKIASFEITHLPLIKEVAKTKKPMIISTGTASLDEIKDAYNCAIKNGSGKIILLYCVTNYPANSEDFNLNNIETLKKTFSCKVGLSDHSKGGEIAKLALICGASVFEKHIALKDVKGPDYEFSLKGNEIKKYSDDLKKVYSLIKEKKFTRNKSEDFYKKYRRSIFIVKNIKKGEKFNNSNLKILRPSIGMEPKYFDKIIGKKSPSNFKQNIPLSKNIFNIIKKGRK